MQTIWANARSTILSEQESAINRATNQFSIGSESSGGHKQTAMHYYNLRQWYQDHIRETYTLLGSCLRGVSQAESEFLDKYTASRNLGAVYREGQDASALNAALSSLAQVASGPYITASTRCQVLDLGSLPHVPERPSLSSLLGPVGTWAGWLLNTEQMPVVIIVGLVGFSVLGATVSRSVRAGTENVTAGITLDDLLIVIASGTTAAVVVFLAAYGGLAVLGNSGGDPNPYIVFATCLVAAVYSDRVWTWARERVLAQAIAAGSTSGAGKGLDQGRSGANERHQPVTPNSGEDSSRESRTQAEEGGEIDQQPPSNVPTRQDPIR